MIARMSCGVLPTSCPCAGLTAPADASGAVVLVCVSTSLDPCRSPPSPTASVVVGAETSLTGLASPGAPPWVEALSGDDAVAAGAAPPPQPTTKRPATTTEEMLSARIRMASTVLQIQRFGRARALCYGLPRSRRRGGRVLRLWLNRVDHAGTSRSRS